MRIPRFVSFILDITATLKLNEWNLYSSALGVVNFVSTTFGRNLHRRITTIVLGLVGTVLAAVGILGQFTGFLIILSVVFPPIAGIMIAEYFIVKVWRPQLDSSRADGTLPVTAPRIVPATIVIWVVSALAGYFITWGIPSLISLFLAMILYIVAGKLGWVRGVGAAQTRQQTAEPVEA